MIAGFDRDRLVPEHVRCFDAYRPSPPDAELCRMYGVSHLHRLHNNENPLGPPDAARDALRTFEAAGAAIYPSGDSWSLREAVSTAWNVAPDQVVVGNGVNEVIAFVVNAFCQEGDNIVTADRTFSVAEWIAEFSGLEPRLIPLRDHRFDAEAMAAAIDDRTKVVFVCNPNNPTGTYWTANEMDAFLERVAGRAVVVIDEAYAEYMDRPDYPDSRSLVARHPNLVAFRTFSKAYGLAGLRVGYLVGAPGPADAIRRTQVVYSVNTLAQAAALAAFTEGAVHLSRSRELVRISRETTERRLSDLGLPIVSHNGNFLMARLPISDTLAYRRLMGLGYIVRPMTAFRFPNWIRVTLAAPEIMNGFADALTTVLRRT